MNIFSELGLKKLNPKEQMNKLLDWTVKVEHRKEKIRMYVRWRKLGYEDWNFKVMGGIDCLRTRLAFREKRAIEFNLYGPKHSSKKGRQTQLVHGMIVK